MNSKWARILPGNRNATSWRGCFRLFGFMGWLAASWAGALGGSPAMANGALPEGDLSTQAQVAADDTAATCGGLPVDAYVNGNSAMLKQTFCQLLTFSPLTIGSIDTFITEIVPDSLVSNDSPSSEEVTLPSLWWSRNTLPRQFGRYRLVDSWNAYEMRVTAIRVVDVHVNSQIWRILQYSERYGALSHLAEEARANQYNLRLFNNNQRDPRLIGLFACDFAGQATDINTTSQSLDVASDCVAVVDEDAIARLQASMELLEDGDQPSAASQPVDIPNVEASPQTDVAQEPSGADN
jgi:hypothetical protein